jgi:putative tricarboxylic transport membrane protein
MENIVTSIGLMFQPLAMVLISIGVVIGIIFGAIPGLTATTGVSLFLPLTFGMTPEMGMAILIGVWVGGVSGGFISATLLGIPGTPASIATCFDAYPLARKGYAVKALATGICASFLGTFSSIIIATFISPFIAEMALKLGPWEYFSLCVCALTLVVTLSKGNMWKGLAAGFLGFTFSFVGLAPIDGGPRFTFGSISLSGGLDILALILGIFAIKQIIKDFAAGEQIQPDISLSVSGIGITIKDIAGNIWNIIRSFFIGVWIGFLPGMGSGLSNMVAYAQAKQSSKHPEEFGKGCIDGVWASEVSNNAAVGGAVIPMVALGIPGDSVTAILLGGLMVHGIQPGPLLFSNNPVTVYFIFITTALAAVITLILQLAGMRLFPMILKIPQYYLYSGLIAMSFVGAFAINNSTFNFWVMLSCAVLAILMDIGEIPVSPLILGFILGPMVEVNLRRGLTYTEGSFLPFLTRPVSLVLLLIGIASILVALLRKSPAERKD